MTKTKENKDVSRVLIEMGVTGYVMRGNPTNADEFMRMFTKVIGVDKQGNAQESNDPQHFGVSWSDIEPRVKQWRKETPMRELRHERNVRLAASDWMVSPDRTTTQQEMDYRQELRDITKTATSLEDVVWPDIGA